MSIPVMIIDEHNDAFYAWHVFIEKGFIQNKDNYLLHIDHHDDMECGGYDWDFQKMPQNPDEALIFVDKCLGIADFIAPAIFQGIFETVHILKNVVPKPIVKEEQFINVKHDCILTIGNYIPFLHSFEKQNPESSYKFFTKIIGGLNYDDPIPKDSLILDIDLDYFCWDDSLKSVPEKKLEITHSAYLDFKNNRNNPFRILPKKLLHVREDEGKYFLVYKENLPQDKLADEGRIIKRIDRLITYILNANISPKAIDICRSSYSGYLPKERANFVERTFISKLSEIIDIKII